jgi:photosystem II stability/assembly factor-like uncharacterized protein
MLLAAAGNAAAEKNFLEVLLETKPRGYLAAFSGVPEELETDNPRAAFEWRLLTMLDEKGKIPPQAFYKANDHRRKNPKKTTNGSPDQLLPPGPGSLSPFSWVSRGPQNVGGRTLALVVHPTNNAILFAGAASGGIWKSTNSGATWSPINDFMANLFIGALAFDPLNPNTMYAGTGERFYDRSVRNAGIFKSTDGGATWTQLAATANWSDVQTIAPQPGSSNVLLAATGSGIYRTTNGGTSWTYINISNVWGSQWVAFDPSSGTRAIAAVSKFDGTVAAYYSLDGGLTFNPSNASLTGPDNSVAYAPSNPSVTYALLGKNNTYAELWRSTDYGVTYTKQGTGGIGCVDRRCTLWVSPTDPNLIVTGGVYLFRSTNGGSTFTQISSGYILTSDPHPDQHCITSDTGYNGTSNRRVYFCTDGGVFRTSDILNAATGSTWSSLVSTYQTAQFYGGAGHAVGSGAYLGGTQDNGNLATTNLNSNAYLALGGDGGFVEIDPTQVNTWYMETQYLYVYRSTNAGSSYSFIGGGISDAGSSTNFIAPLALDPNQPNTLYAGGANLWRTTNASAPSPTWAVAKSSVDYISAIAVAKGNSNIVYVGHNSGLIQKTVNGTAATPTWSYIDNNASTNPLPDRYVTRIYCDPEDTNTVYVAFGGFTLDNLWKSTNGGATFVSVSGSGATSLPPSPVRGIVRHPRNPFHLYAGTEVGIFESEDGGQSWLTTEAGPSDVMIDELRFVIGTETLLAATHGRGFWTADTSGVPSIAPSNLIATASGTSVVNLTWTGVSGAASYQILRSSDGLAYSVLTTVGPTSYADSAVVGGKTYLYKVKAFYNSVLTDASNVDLATTMVFTDDNQLPGTNALAVHLQEIRNATNAVRLASGLPALTFSNPAIAGSSILAADITDLRNGLIPAYSNIGMPALSFAETVTAGVTEIKASHTQEIRNAAK